MNLLLLSNSTLPDQPFLGWPKSHIKSFLGEKKNVLFIPFAAVTFSYDEYERMVRESLGEIDLTVRSIHRESDPFSAVNEADVIIVGGGNTFNLLSTLYQMDLVEAIQNRIQNGGSYIGWSAGANLACPTIRTTNDMPIMQPPSFDALNLFEWQINPHYTELTIEGHGGESRLQRLKEYLVLNDIPVICLPEGCGIKVMDDSRELISNEDVKVLFQDGHIDHINPGKF